MVRPLSLDTKNRIAISFQADPAAMTPLIKHVEQRTKLLTEINYRSCGIQTQLQLGSLKHDTSHRLTLR